MRRIPEGTAMERIWIVLLAVAVAFAIVLPAGLLVGRRRDRVGS